MVVILMVVKAILQEEKDLQLFLRSHDNVFSPVLVYQQ